MKNTNKKKQTPSPSRTSSGSTKSALQRKGQANFRHSSGYQGSFQNFTLETVTILSKALKNNPLKDPNVRHNPVLVPNSMTTRKNDSLALVLVLSGFGGNGPKYIADKGFDQNFAQQIDRLVTEKRAPENALYVFVDTWTSWGGSQFINSRAVGNYETYLARELLPALLLAFPAVNPKAVALIGSSSGGYGALHLSTKYPQSFPYAIALAPDAQFELSYKEDILKAAPMAADSGPNQIMALHRAGELLKRKNGFHILNAFAMSAIYSPATGRGAERTDFEFPVDTDTGEFIPKIFKRWKQHDPIEFLPKRRGALQQLKGLYLEVGSLDEFHLQYGARKIHLLLERYSVPHHYHEFKGTGSSLI
jgi:enterochelin esterase family protein